MAHANVIVLNGGSSVVSKDIGLEEELRDVEAASIALQEYMRAPNIPLPEGFPTHQLAEICGSLGNLPAGTSDGCRVPLEYARLRLPAIRRDHITRETAEDPRGEPKHSRGMGIDRPLSDLIIAVTTALDAYSRVSSAKLDDSSAEEIQIDPGVSSETESTIEKSNKLSEHLKTATDEAAKVFDVGLAEADRFERILVDTENLNTLARAELRGRVVLRWFRKVVSALKVTPGKLRFAAKSLKTAKAAAEIWDNFNSKVFKATIEALDETADKFEQEARSLEAKISPARVGKSDSFDLDEVIRLIESGRQISNENVRFVTSLELKNYRPRNATPLSNLEFLQNLKIVGGSLDDVEGLSNLTGMSSLHIGRIARADLSSLQKLTKVKHLTLSGDITDISFLTSMNSLQSLKINSGSLRDWSPLSSLSQLRSLYISGDRGFQVDMMDISKCTHIEELTVWGLSLLNMRVLANFTELRSVDLRRVRGVELTHLLGLPKLRKVRTKDIDPPNKDALIALRKTGVNASVQ